jgi:hypothetical protein
VSFIFAMRDWISRKVRTRNKSRDYQRYVNESTKSLEERLRFHFEHLKLYWQRCEAFIPMWSLETVMSGLFHDIPAASQATTFDLNKLQNANTQLLQRHWTMYLQALRNVQASKVDTQLLFSNAHEAFKQAHDTFMKLDIH